MTCRVPAGLVLGSRKRWSINKGPIGTMSLPEGLETQLQSRSWWTGQTH